MNGQHLPAAQSSAVYHGSISELWGPVHVVAECDCDTCADEPISSLLGLPPQRWELVTPDGQRLVHVRPQSFTRDHRGDNTR